MVFQSGWSLQACHLSLMTIAMPMPGLASEKAEALKKGAGGFIGRMMSPRCKCAVHQVSSDSMLFTGQCGIKGLLWQTCIMRSKAIGYAHP